LTASSASRKPRSRAGLSSMKLPAPGARQPNRTTVAEPNVSPPPVTSNSRGMRLSSVVLPLPVPPMIAVTSPGLASSPMWHSTGSSAPG